jgi:hypothetical protein
VHNGVQIEKKTQNKGSTMVIVQIEVDLLLVIDQIKCLTLTDYRSESMQRSIPKRKQVLKTVGQLLHVRYGNVVKCV